MAIRVASDLIVCTQYFRLFYIFVIHCAHKRAWPLLYSFIIEYDEGHPLLLLTAVYCICDKFERVSWMTPENRVYSDKYRVLVTCLRVDDCSHFFCT